MNDHAIATAVIVGSLTAAQILDSRGYPMVPVNSMLDGGTPNRARLGASSVVAAMNEELADPAVGTGVGQVTSGAPDRSERVVKSNRFMSIDSAVPGLRYGLDRTRRFIVARHLVGAEATRRWAT